MASVGVLDLQRLPTGASAVAEIAAVAGEFGRGGRLAFDFPGCLRPEFVFSTDRAAGQFPEMIGAVPYGSVIIDCWHGASFYTLTGLKCYVIDCVERSN
jgi:hypothetical protein